MDLSDNFKELLVSLMTLSFIPTNKLNWLWFAIPLRIIILVIFIFLYKKYEDRILGLYASSSSSLLSALVFIPLAFPVVQVFPKFGIIALIIVPIIAFGILPVIFYNDLLQKEKIKINYKKACLLLPISISILFLFLMLFLALEGIVCIVMALPVIIIGSFVGANMAYFFLTRKNSKVQNSHFAAPLLLIPLLLQPIDNTFWVKSAENNISSSIIIKATPAQIWPQVMAYSQLENPLAINRPIDVLFSLGLPAPEKAWIECEKIGCKRKCIFNQKVVFNETITTFKPNEELTFNVKTKVGKQNILTGVDPHIMPGGLYFNSLKGQYRLEEIKPGFTKLSGTSWYSLKSSMNWYFRPWSNIIIQAVHLKVFEHIKSQTENKF